MTAKETSFTTKGRNIVVKHNCQTATFTIEEAIELNQKLLNSISEAEKYEPTIIDLYADIFNISEDILATKLLSDAPTKKKAKKKGSKPTKKFSPEIQLVDFIMTHQNQFENFANLFDKLLLMAYSEKYQKEYQKMLDHKKEEQARQKENEEKNKAILLEFANEFDKYLATDKDDIFDDYDLETLNFSTETSYQYMLEEIEGQYEYIIEYFGGEDLKDIDHVKYPNLVSATNAMMKIMATA